MKSAKLMAYLGTLLLAAGLMTACGNAPLKGGLGIKGAPDWVDQGTQVLNDQDGKVIHGVAMVQAMPDLSLQESTADTRARAEVARVLNTFIHDATQDYNAAAGTGKDQSVDQSISRQLQTITDQNLSGVIILQRWHNPNDGSMWSIAALKLSQVKDSIANAQDLNAGFRDYFKANADNIFDSMKAKGDHQ